MELASAPGADRQSSLYVARHRPAEKLGDSWVVGQDPRTFQRGWLAWVTAVAG
jgi:hypothetical protein